MATGNEKLEAGLLEWKKQKSKEDLSYALLSAAGIVTLLAVWRLVVSAGLVNERMLPAPTQTFETLVYKFVNKAPDGDAPWVNVLASLQVALSGFLAAIIIGVPLGLVMGWWAYADRFIRPIFELVRPVPPIAWIPLVVVWVGIDLKAKALIIFFTAFVPCVINSYTGIKLTSKTLINVSRTFGASNTEIFWKVGVPSSFPMVFAGIHVALGNSWSTLAAAEMLAAGAGLGYMIQIGRTVARPDIVTVGMVAIGATGVILSGLLSRAEKYFLRWKVNRQEGVRNTDVASKQQKTLGNVLYYGLLILAILTTAVGWVLFSDSRPELMPAPADVWVRFVKTFTKPTTETSLAGHAWASLRRVPMALLIAWAFGISFGILIGWNEKCKAFFGSIFEVIRPIPPIAWIPIVIMWFGIGEFPKVLLVFIGAFVPLVINTSTGIEMVDKINLNVGHVFGKNNRQVPTDIIIPTVLPPIFAGIRTSVSSGWTTVLAVEMLGARKGLEALVTRGWQGSDMALVLVSVITIAIIGALLSLGLQKFEEVVCPWNN